WRRTGLPEITPGPDNVNNNQVPLRFTYPTAEQALNGDNWNAAVDRIGGDDNINAVMWLLQ
ncbi:MAG: SusD/RagB family nutrient-binding outer membrane lipoprotein, partial [Bacteroidota bacterium]